MASVYPRKNKDGTTSYRVVIRRKGKKTFCISWPTREQAIDFVEQYEKDYVLHGLEPMIDRLQHRREKEFSK